MPHPAPLDLPSCMQVLQVMPVAKLVAPVQLGLLPPALLPKLQAAKQFPLAPQTTITTALPAIPPAPSPPGTTIQEMHHPPNHPCPPRHPPRRHGFQPAPPRQPPRPRRMPLESRGLPAAHQQGRPRTMPPWHPCRPGPAPLCQHPPSRCGTCSDSRMLGRCPLAANTRGM